MSDDSYLLENKDKKRVNWLSRLLKLVFILSAFFLVIITVLANMGGNSETLKDGVRSFVSEIFAGRPVEIKRLNHMGFFPTVGIDVEGLSILSKPENGYPIIEIGRLQAFMSFWNVATRNPRVTGLYLEQVKALKGVFGPQDFFIEKVYIDHDLEAATAMLRGKGKIGVHSWTISAGMDVYGSSGNYSYRLAHNFPVNAQIADLTFNGIFTNHKNDYFKIESFTLAHGEKTLSGNLILSALGKNLLKLKARLNTQNDQSVLDADLIVDSSTYPRKFSGDINSENMVLSEIIGEDSIFSIITRMREIMGYQALYAQTNDPLAFLGQYNLDLNTDFKNLILSNNQQIPLSAKFLQEQGRLKLGPIQSGETTVLPVLMLVPNKETGQVIAIFQDGAINASILRFALPNIPREFNEIECGLGILEPNAKELKIKYFNINTPLETLAIEENALPKDKNIEELKFKMLREKQTLPIMEFEKQSYDFIQSSLQSTSAGSKCAPFITLEPQITEQDAVETTP